MKLIIEGNISRTYVQNLCLLFFPGAKFSETEEVTPETPVLNVTVTETAESVSATAHLQLGDNTGYGDLHGMPLDGTTDWPTLIPQLKKCPRMESYQTEVEMEYGTNWAGKLLAPVGGYSIKRLAETFQRLGFAEQAIR